MLIPQKISERATASAITGAEIIPLIQGGDDCIVTAAILLAWGNITGKEAVWTSANSNLSTVDWTAKILNAETAILSNLTAGYLPYHTVNGLVNSGIWTDGTKVGIGTTSPWSKLDVCDDILSGAVFLNIGNTNFPVNGGVTQAVGIQFKLQSNVSGQAQGVGGSIMRPAGSIILGKDDDWYNPTYAGSTFNSNMQFHTYLAGDDYERMRITSAGNVGIGFATPLSKCAINGGLHVGGESNAGDNNLLVDGTITGNGGLQTFGANDSAGTGYRTVRVPNI